MRATSKKIKYLHLICIAAILHLIGGGSAMAAENREIKLGFAIAQSGWMTDYDKSATQAALLEIEEINAGGGILGSKLVPIVEDTRTDVTRAAEAAQSLLAKGVSVMFVSCDYDMGSPAALAAKSAGIVSIFLCAADIKAGVQGIGPHSYSASSVANGEGATMAEWSYTKRNVREGYLLVDTSLQYNRSLCAGFDWMFPQLPGANIVGRDTFKSGDSTIASQITRIKALPKQPDAIMLCSCMPAAASATRQLRAAGITAPILGSVATDGDYWLDSVPGLTKFFGLARGSFRGDDPRPDVNAFVERYATKYGARPINQSAFDGYLAVELWSKAVKKAGTFESDAVVGALNSFKNEETLIGPRTFTPDVHTQLQVPFLITEVDGGKSRVVDQFTLSKPIPLDVLLKR